MSDRELETFQLLGKGYETRQVAEMMNVSMKTVQAHCAHIKEKLKLTNAANCCARPSAGRKTIRPAERSHAYPRVEARMERAAGL